MRSGVAVVSCFVVILANHAEAQIAGKTTAGGQPVPEARVELWSPTQRLAQRVTNDRGEFRFTAEDAHGAVAIAVRRIGYSPTRVVIDTASAAFVVEMTPLPAALPEVSTRTAATLCPNVESAEARALWDAATRTYLGWEADMMGRGTELTQFLGHVHRDSLGAIDTARLTRGARRAVSGSLAGGRRLIESRGYVRLLTAPHWEPDFGIWGYASLQSWHAAHFATPLFVGRHTLNVLAGDTREVTLVFCPRSRRETGLEGTLRLGRDGAFIAARWTYWNPHRNRESAGGEVVFAPPGRSADGQPLPLLPLSGLFWRKQPNGRYWQRWEEYDRWILSPSGLNEAGADSARARTRSPPPRGQ